MLMSPKINSANWINSKRPTRKKPAFFRRKKLNIKTLERFSMNNDSRFLHSARRSIGLNNQEELASLSGDLAQDGLQPLERRIM
jgi:hypothetical protein